mgnify:CR=1 FL=1
MQRVALQASAKNVIYWHVRDLLLDNANVFLVCHYPHILDRTDWLQSIYCQLNEGTPHAHHINELLWVIEGRHWPKAATNAAGHNNDLRIVIHYIILNAYKIIDYQKTTLFLPIKKLLLSSDKILAGIPPTIQLSGISFVTTEFAAITTLFPI